MECSSVQFAVVVVNHHITYSYRLVYIKHFQNKHTSPKYATYGFDSQILLMSNFLLIFNNSYLFALCVRT